MKVIEIVSFEDDSVVKQIECGDSWEKAERVERGLGINLNHDKFYTRIRDIL